MDILFGLGLSLHLGLAGSYNEIHPQVRFEADHFVAGAFYNSNADVSTYLGMQYEFDNNVFVEGGLVTGYPTEYLALPYVRLGYSIDETSNLFIAPAFEGTGPDRVGLVAGIEVFFK